MDDNQSKPKNAFTQVLKFLLRLLELGFLLLCWLVYSFLTLNRSEQALAYTGGNPLPSKYSFFVLALVLVFFLRKSLFEKKWSVAHILQRLFVSLVLVGGVLIYFANQGLR